ncbi:MAG: hypothetical protein OEU26_14340 [Candidatus Tectomicrobia bacterium]|nr:hypothetical protein [Candidatus Tectomicrobia bacterium]
MRNDGAAADRPVLFRSLSLAVKPILRQPLRVVLLILLGFGWLCSGTLQAEDITADQAMRFYQNKLQHDASDAGIDYGLENAGRVQRRYGIIISLGSHAQPATRHRGGDATARVRAVVLPHQPTSCQGMGQAVGDSLSHVV